MSLPGSHGDIMRSLPYVSESAIDRQLYELNYMAHLARLRASQPTIKQDRLYSHENLVTRMRHNRRQNHRILTRAEEIEQANERLVARLTALTMFPNQINGTRPAPLSKVNLTHNHLAGVQKLKKLESDRIERENFSLAARLLTRSGQYNNKEFDKHWKIHQERLSVLSRRKGIELKAKTPSLEEWERKKKEKWEKREKNRRPSGKNQPNQQIGNNREENRLQQEEKHYSTAEELEKRKEFNKTNGENKKRRPKKEKNNEAFEEEEEDDDEEESRLSPLSPSMHPNSFNRRRFLFDSSASSFPPDVFAELDRQMPVPITLLTQDGQYIVQWKEAPQNKEEEKSQAEMRRSARGAPPPRQPPPKKNLPSFPLTSVDPAYQPAPIFQNPLEQLEEMGIFTQRENLPKITQTRQTTKSP